MKHAIFDPKYTKEVSFGIFPILKGHQKLISSLVFSPNGKHIVSGSHDCKAIVWNISEVS